MNGLGNVVPSAPFLSTQSCPRLSCGPLSSSQVALKTLCRARGVVQPRGRANGWNKPRRVRPLTIGSVCSTFVPWSAIARVSFCSQHGLNSARCGERHQMTSSLALPSKFKVCSSDSLVRALSETQNSSPHGCLISQFACAAHAAYADTSKQFVGQMAPSWQLVLEGREPDGSPAGQQKYIYAVSQMRKRVQELLESKRVKYVAVIQATANGEEPSDVELAVEAPAEVPSNEAPAATDAPITPIANPKMESKSVHVQDKPPSNTPMRQQQQAERLRWYQQLRTHNSSESVSSPEFRSPSGTWETLVISIDVSHKCLIEETTKRPFDSRQRAPTLSLQVSSSPEVELPSIANARKQVALDTTSLERATRFAAELSGPPLSLTTSPSAPAITEGAANKRSIMRQSPLVLPRIVKPGRRPPTLRTGVDDERDAKSTLDNGFAPLFRVPTVLQTSPSASPSPMKRSAFPHRIGVAEVRRVLVQLPWLQGINKRELHLMSVKMSQHSVPKFHVIFNERMFGDRIYVLAHGAVRLTGSNPKHSRNVRAIGSFGESAVISPADRNTTAVALTPSLLLSLSYSELNDVQAHSIQQSTVSREITTTTTNPATPDVHLALIGTVAAMLRRNKLLEDSQMDIAAEAEGPSEEDFTEVRRSVKLNASLVDFATRRSVQLEAPDALEKLQSKFGGPSIMSYNLPPQEAVVDPSADYSLPNPRPNVGDALSARAYVAAGRVNLLGASAIWREQPDGRKYLALVRLGPGGEGPDEAEYRIAPPPSDYGRIYGRPPGTPPKHLLGVRAREARLGSNAVADARAKADAIQAKIDAEIERQDRRSNE